MIKKKKAYRTFFRDKKDIGFTDAMNDLLPLMMKDLPPSKKVMVNWLNAAILNEEYELDKIKPFTEIGKKIASQTKFDNNPIIVIAI